MATEFYLLRHLNVDNDVVHARQGSNGAIARFVYPSEVRLSNVNRVRTSGVEGGSADVTVTEMLSAGVRPQVQMRKLLSRGRLGSCMVSAAIVVWRCLPRVGGGPILPFFQTRARKWEAVVLLAWLATAMESTRGQCGDCTEFDSSVESHMERILGCKRAKKEVCGKTTPQLQHQSSGRKIRVTCLTLKRHSVEARLHWRYLTPQACAVRRGRLQEKQPLPRVWTL